MDPKPPLILRAFDAAAAALESLGVQGARWQWRKQVWRHRLEERITTEQNVERAEQVSLRMCHNCRALVPRNLKVCSECGVDLRRRMASGGGFLELLFPSMGSVTVALITANCALYLLMLATWGIQEQAGGFFGMLSPPGEALFVFGGKWTPAVAGGEVWRLVTANFLHGGLIHLVFNCYALANLGPLVENSFGRRKFFLIYLATGVSAFAASALFSPRTLSIGSSGSIFGLLGLAIVFGKFRSGPLGQEIARQLMRWVFLGLILIMVPGIDHAAHIGGFAAGAGLAMLLDPGEPRQGPRDQVLRLLTLIAVAAVTLSFGAMLLSYRGNVAAITGG